MIPYDLCIIGSGPAGISLAKEIITSKPNTKIAIIESGNIERNPNFFNKQLESFSKLNHINRVINPVHENRLFLFGGTTNHWGGWCRPLDDEDFYIRKGYSKNYWPIDRSEIDKYLNKTKEFLDLSESFDLKESEVRFSQKEKKLFELEQINFDFSHRDVVYDKYNNLKNKIKFFFNHIAFKLIINNQKDFIESLEIINTTTKEKKKIFAKFFIICAGGMETTRFFLNNNKFYKKNYFDKSGLLGKGFNDHPHFPVGDYVCFNPMHRSNEIIFLKNNINFQLNNKILNSSIRLYKDNSRKKQLISDFKNLFLNKKEKILYTGFIYVISEMEVRNENKLTLSNNIFDDFGIPQINFHFSFSEVDLETIRIPSINIAKFISKFNYGRVKLRDWIIDSSVEPFYEQSGWVGHHMGTTRMGNLVSNSIVDKNLKLHTLDNGYILSSSVFPTGGSSNPTFTIVSLALRLADHLKKLV